MHTQQQPPRSRRASGATAVIGDTIHGLRGHRRRIIPTFIAVLLGVAFAAGTLILTDTLRSAFSAMHADNHAGVDVAVRLPASFGEGTGARRDLIDAALAADVETIDGVAAVAGRASGWAQLVGPAGELLGDVSSGVDPIGENWIHDAQLSSWAIADGAPPNGPNELAIDRAAAEQLGAAVGDTIEVTALGGVHEMAISGIATFNDADRRFGTVTALFDTPTAQLLLGAPDRFDSLLVRVTDDASADDVARRIALADLGTDIEAVTGAELAAEAHATHTEDWKFFDTFMFGFAVIALVVGGFIIFNTFSITVAQRSREFALLRAVGAGRGQILGSVLVESLVVGVLASVLGLAGGVGVSRGLHSLFGVVGIDLPDSGMVLAGRSLVVAFGLGLAITLLAAAMPAVRAARIPPVAAMREIAVDRAGSSRMRVAVGAALVAGGGASIAIGLGSSGAVSLVGLGGLAVFAGSTVLGPVLIGPFARFVGRPIVRLRGVTGHLARNNAVRCPKRTAATAGALTIGVGLVGLITIVAASVKASIDDMVSAGVRADVIVDSNSVGFGGVDRSLAAALRELPEVSAVSGMALTTVELDGEVVDVTAVDTAHLGSLLDLGHVDGSLAGADGSGLGTGQVAVNSDLAAARGWEVGSPVTVVLTDGIARDLTVGAVIEDPFIGLPTIVDAALLERAGLRSFDLQVFVGLADGIDADSGIAAVTDVASAFPQVDVLDQAEFADHRSALVDPLLGVIYALLGFVVLIAALGITNTLVLSTMERTRELGVLRAIGSSKSQIRQLVRWESALIAGFGTSLGLVIGTGFGWAVVRALESEGITNLVIPATHLVVVSGLAAATGMVAAALPGRRAARIDVLDALRS